MLSAFCLFTSLAVFVVVVVVVVVDVVVISSQTLFLNVAIRSTLRNKNKINFLKLNKNRSRFVKEEIGF